MTEFENILNEANKKNGNEQVAGEAPAEKEKKSYVLMMKLLVNY